MAIGVSNWLNGVKSDPRYLKWIVQYYEQNDKGESIIKSYPMHVCTEADYAKFHPAADDVLAKLEELKKEGGLFCLNWQEHGEQMYGTFVNGGSYTAMDVLAVPCGFQYTAYDGSEYGARDDCNWD